MKGEYKFQELMNYFKIQTLSSITLTYADIERICGFTLCESAYKYEEYWGASKTHTVTRAWLENGYKVNDVKIGKYINFIKII